MNIKDKEQFALKIIESAPSYGFEECEVSFGNATAMSIMILNGEVQSYERSNDQGISFRGKKNGQMASSGTNEFTDEAIDFMLSSASDSCDVLDDEDEDFIYCDPDNKELYFSQITDAFDKCTYNRFAELGLKLEKDILALDPSIKAVDYLSLSCDRAASMKINSKGLRAYKDSDFVSLFAEGRAERDGIVKSGGHYWYGNDIDKFDEGEFLKTFSHKILDKFGGSSVKSGKYDVILSNEAMISFLATFLPNFSSYSMQKGISLLAGKEGERIASSCVTITEEPMYDKALIKVPFDSEGVITSSKSIIEDGIFKTAFYNLKTANKAGIKSTGNGLKGGISFTNLIVKPGAKNFAELCETVKDGLYITELNGLHAGVNTISGDFSLFCEGFLIKDGKLDHAVEQITLSDNFYDVLQKISELGNDTISEPEGAGEIFTPSAIIKDISVAGDA